MQIFRLGALMTCRESIIWSTILINFWNQSFLTRFKDELIKYEALTLILYLYIFWKKLHKQFYFVPVSILLFQAFMFFNPNRWGILNVACVGVGRSILPAPSRPSRNTVNYFDFLKVHNKLGKVKKFWTNRPLFSWRNSRLELVRAQSTPPQVINIKAK